MKAWFQRFMSGRYGSDTFGNFLCVTALVCLVIGLFVGIFYYIGLLLLLYAYFRMLSRNVHKRYAENIAFMQKPLVCAPSSASCSSGLPCAKPTAIFPARTAASRYACPRAAAKFPSPAPNAAPSSLKKVKGFPFTSMKG